MSILTFYENTIPYYLCEILTALIIIVLYNIIFTKLAKVNYIENFIDLTLLAGQFQNE